MSTRNLSEPQGDAVPQATHMRFGIAVAEWNSEVTEALLRGAIDTLTEKGAAAENIEVMHVPGSFELPLAGQWLAKTGRFDAIILLGCVIQGETRHFDFICEGVTQGTMELNLAFNLPFVFGVLTTQDQQQARDRAGGKHGNKGIEAALTAIKMVSVRNSIH